MAFKISKLKRNPNNPRQIRDAQFERLKKSIEEFGAVMMPLRPIVYDESLTVLGGNMRLQAIKALGMKEVPDDWVRRVEDLSEDEKRRFIIVDNNSFGEYDWDLLSGGVWQDLPLADWGVDIPDDWSTAGADGNAPGGGGDEFPVEPDEQQTRVQYGDLWQCGRHRVLCGDSTKAADVKRLMGGEKVQVVVTDPPYGIDYNRHIPKQKHGDLQNDEAPKPQQLLSAMPDAEAFYVWSRWDVLQQWMDAIHLPIRNVIVWDKQTNGMGDLSTTFAPSWEACIFASKAGHKLRGGRDRDVWAASRASSEDHLTPKPVELISRCVEKSSDKGHLITDLYLGSGTTLIAAERTGRKCYGIEISPKYVNVILSRYEAETGHTAELIERVK